MQTWIDRVFINGQYQHGGMPKRDLAAMKQEYRMNALQLLAEGKADHVVYCYIEYDAEGDIVKANFYSLPMDDDEFYKTTSELTGDHYVGAVHRIK